MNALEFIQLKRKVEDFWTSQGHKIVWDDSHPYYARCEKCWESLRFCNSGAHYSTESVCKPKVPLTVKRLKEILAQVPDEALCYRGDWEASEMLLYEHQIRYNKRGLLLDTYGVESEEDEEEATADGGEPDTKCLRCGAELMLSIDEDYNDTIYCPNCN